MAFIRWHLNEKILRYQTVNKIGNCIFEIASTLPRTNGLKSSFVNKSFDIQLLIATHVECKEIRGDKHGLKRNSSISSQWNTASRNTLLVHIPLAYTSKRVNFVYIACWNLINNIVLSGESLLSYNPLSESMMTQSYEDSPVRENCVDISLIDVRLIYDRLFKSLLLKSANKKVYFYFETTSLTGWAQA